VDKKELIIQVLKNHDIPYWTAGKNVGAGNVNIRCPHCSDTSNHCSIFPSTLVFHCWRCNAKGGFAYLVSVVSGIPYDEILKEVEDGTTPSDKSVTDRIHEFFELDSTKSDLDKPLVDIDLPDYYEPINEFLEPCSLLDKYLERRKYTRGFVESKGCGICRVGQWMGRMIIPVFFGQKMVAYQGADMTGSADQKYKADGHESQIKKVLYEYDGIEAGGRMILTEGILDCWRVGKDAVCSFGTSLTPQQIGLILEKKPFHLIFMWDADAYWKARERAKMFYPLINKVSVVNLPYDSDPDELSREQIDQILSSA
jgi:hypothetical protein